MELVAFNYIEAFFKLADKILFDHLTIKTMFNSMNKLVLSVCFLM